MVEQSFAQKTDSSIVNLGYGITQSSDELSAAVGVATAEELDNFFAINPENALYGLIPGLTVLQNGGNWWSQGAGMYVRGQSNLDNTSAPLILIDGFERDISTITVADIQSMSVLKDAAATALYGQRGANGVILVTTKRGIDEGLQVDFTYERSVNTPFRMPQMLDAYGYASAMNEALALDGKDYLYSKEQLDAYKDGTYPEYYPNVNWFDEVLRSTGFVNDLNTTFKGGKGKTRYYISLNYIGGEGLLKQDRNIANYSTQLDYSRANVRTNLDIELTKTTMLKFNMSGRISGTNRPGRATSDNLFSNLYGTPSNAFPIQYADGKWGGTPVFGENPVAVVNATGFATSHERTFYTDLTLTQDLSVILEGLALSAAVSFDNNVAYWDSKRKDFSYEYRTADIDEINGVLYNLTSTTLGEATDLTAGTSFGGQNRHMNGIVRLNYDKQWGKHALNVMGLFHEDNAIGVGINTTFYRINNAGYIHYAFDKKYFADVTMSYSGNNIMPEGDHFRFYPALSVGWMLSKESFLSESTRVNMLKLRASAGFVGLEPNTPYLDVPMYSNGQNYFFSDNNNSTGGIEEDRRANPNVEPEKGFISNVGVDARLFGNLSLNVDVFYEKRSQILVSEAASTSNVIGLASTMLANGIVENRGVEIGALWSQSLGDFNFALGAQYSLAKNKIIEQNETFREWDYLRRTGLPVDQVFGLQDDGFWGESDGLNGVDNVAPDGVQYSFTQVLKPGDVKYVDQNDDNIIDQFDVISIGHNWLPEMYFSFTVNAEYKGIGLLALLQGASNVSVNLNTTGIFWPLYNNNNISTFSNDRWTPATASTATLPRLTPEKNDNNYRNSTIWQRDASFLKLRTLELYYNLPESVVNKAKLERARVFVRGMNLFSIDNIEIMDPEVIGTNYPTLKSFNVGVSFGF